MYDFPDFPLDNFTTFEHNNVDPCLDEQSFANFAIRGRFFKNTKIAQIFNVLRLSRHNYPMITERWKSAN